MDRGEPCSRRRGTPMDAALAMEIEGLRKLKTKALQARYRELFGEESRSSNRAHLFRRIAWRLQAKAQGDLSERARKRAAELADDADLRLRAPRCFWRADGSVGREPRAARREAVAGRHWGGPDRLRGGVQGGPAEPVVAGLHALVVAVRQAWRELRLGDAGLQHRHLDGPAHAQHPALVCGVRARNH